MDARLRCDQAFFETTTRVAEGLVKAAKDEALVIMTLYSPFMWAAQLARMVDDQLAHVNKRCDAVRASEGLFLSDLRSAT